MRRHVYGCLLALAVLALVALTDRPAHSTSSRAVALASRAYLPVVVRPVQGTIILSSTADGSGRPSPPMTTISAGSRQLYYAVDVRGAGGQPYRIEYELPSGPIEPDVGTLTSHEFSSLGLICYTSNADCSQPTGPLLPGTYTIRLFVNNQLIAQSSVTVLASPDQTSADDAAPHVMPRP